MIINEYVYMVSSNEAWA